MSHFAIIQLECLITMAIISDERGRYVSLICDDSRDLILFHVDKNRARKSVSPDPVKWDEVWISIFTKQPCLSSFSAGGQTEPFIIFIRLIISWFQNSPKSFFCDLFLAYNNSVIWCFCTKQCKRTQIDPWWISQNVWHLVHFLHNVLFFCLVFSHPLFVLCLKYWKSQQRDWQLKQFPSFVYVCMSVCVLS